MALFQFFCIAPVRTWITKIEEASGFVYHLRRAGMSLGLDKLEDVYAWMGARNPSNL
jgi:hypothetical protein